LRSSIKKSQSDFILVT